MIILLENIHVNPARGGAPRQTDRRVCAAAKGVFFKKTKMHCKGGPFDKCTVRVEISVNLGKTKNFCQKV